MWKSGDTVGGAGTTYNPSKKATHAVIFMHGLGDTCAGWASGMKGLFDRNDNIHQGTKFPRTTFLCVQI